VIPKQLDVPVLLVKAQEFIPEINVETIPELMTDDFGWRRFYSDLTILECDSNHFSMLVEPSPAQWVSGMLEWIKKQFS
jgi:thioesterase domain-containing protein